MKLPEIKYSTQVRPITKQDPFTAIRDMKSGMQMVETVEGIYNGVQQDKATEFGGVAMARMAEIQAEAATHPEPLERPDIVREKAKEIDNEAKNNLSTTAYSMFQKKFADKSGALINQFTINSAIEANTTQRKGFVESAGEIATSGDITTANEMIDESVMFSDSEKELLRKDMRMRQEVGTIERIKYSGDPVRIGAVLENVMSDDYTGPLEGNDREAAIADLSNAFKMANAENEAKAAHEAGRMWGDLKLAVSNGEAGMVEINHAYDTNPDVINESRRAELMMLADRVADEKVKSAELTSLVDWSLANAEPLNNKNTDHNKAVNAYYERDPSFENGIMLAAKSNIMPDKMEDEFRRLPFLGKPEKVLELANSYEILERESPLSLENIGTKQAAVLGTVSMMYRSGVPIDQAVEIARENASKPPEVQLTLQNEYRSFVKGDPSVKRLDSAMDSDDRFDISYGLGGAPEAPAALRSSYSALEMEYYKYTNGDIEMASKLAFQHVARVFSGTEINDKDQVIAYAPERVTGLPVNYLRKDLKRQAKKANLNSERVMVVPDAQTAREQGLKSYPIYEIDKLENPVPTGVRWTPNIEGYHKEKLGKAKKKREDIRVGMEMDVGVNP